MAIIVSQVKTTLEESSNQDRIWEAARKTSFSDTGATKTLFAFVSVEEASIEKLHLSLNDR